MASVRIKVEKAREMAVMAVKVIDARWCDPSDIVRLSLHRKTAVQILELCRESDDGFLLLDSGEICTLKMHNDESVLERRYNELLNQPQTTKPEPEIKEPAVEVETHLGAFLKACGIYVLCVLFGSAGVGLSYIILRLFI